MSTASSTTDLRCVVVTPEKTVLEADADFVVLPLYDGEMGIAPLHSPMIGRLGYGELRIRAGDQTSRYYVNGGFVQVVDNLVSVLTNRAIEASQVDGDVAREQLRDALARKVRGDDQLALRERMVAQARAQMRMAGRAD